MKEFIDRIDNVGKNLIEANDYTADQAGDDIIGIVAEMQEYQHPSEMTQQEYDDIQALSDIAQRNGKQGDGLDHDLVKPLQDAQRLIMMRVGSRQWVQIHDNKPSF